jgi:hypothetical protein
MLTKVFGPRYGSMVVRTRTRSVQAGRRRRRAVAARHVLETLETRQLLSVMVMTDQTDYLPGAVAQISATGFLANETVQFQVLHTDGTAQGLNETPWQVTDTSGTGNLSASWNLDPSDTGSFELIAVGQTSGSMATALFDDSSQFSPPIIPAASTVATDQADYGPPATVNISAAGFQPNETVQFQVLHTDGTPQGPNEAPWQVTDTSGTGNIQTSWNLTADDAGPSFTVIAIGETSGDVATYNFTDRTLSSVSVGAQTPSPIAQGSSSTYNVSLTSSGSNSLSVTLSISGLPSGVTSVFSTNPVNMTATSASSTLTITNNTGTAGSYTFTVTATPATGTARTANGTLVLAGSISLSQSSINEGSSDFPITVTAVSGATFNASSHVMWNGTALTTTYISSTSLTATVPAANVTDESTASITVSNVPVVPATVTVNEADNFTALDSKQITIPFVPNSSFSGIVATLHDSFDNQYPSSFAVSINWGDGSSGSGTATRTGVGTYDITGSHRYTAPYWQTTARSGTTTTIPSAGTPYTIPVLNNGTTNFPGSGTLVVFTSTGYQMITYTGKTTGTNTTTFTGCLGGTPGTTIGSLATITQDFAPSVTVTDPSPGTASISTTDTLTDGITYGPSAGNFSTTEGAVYTGSSPFFPGSIATSVFPTISYYLMKVTAGSSTAWYTLYTSGPNNYMYPNSTTGSVVFPDEGSVSYTETTYRSAGTIACSAGGTVTVNDAGLNYYSAVNAYNSVENGDTGKIQVGRFLDALSGDNHGDFTVTIHWGDGNNDTVAAVYSGANGSQTTYTITAAHTYAEEGSYSVTYDVADDGGSKLTGIHTADVTVSDPDVSASKAADFTKTYDAVAVGMSPVATFTDPAGAEANDGTHYTATVKWDDTNTSSGTITYDSTSKTFTVSATVPYVNAGEYSPVVTINHETSTAQTVTDSVVINKRLATWTTNANSKTYGDADPVPLTTGSGSNFVDNVSASYSRASGESVAGSPYHITATLSAAAGVLDNYTITNAGADFTINKATTSVQVVSSGNPSVLGQSVTFTATIQPQFPDTPTGSVIFTDTFNSATTTVATVNLPSGSNTVSFSISSLAVGSHTIGAAYGGDGSLKGSTGGMTQAQ